MKQQGIKGSVASAAPRHAQLRELCRDVPAMRGGADLLVDIKNPSVHPDIERPPRREGLIFIHDAVRRGHLTGRIAQERIVDAQRLGKRFVRLGCVDADCEMRGVELPNRVATLTE